MRCPRLEENRIYSHVRYLPPKRSGWSNGVEDDWGAEGAGHPQRYSIVTVGSNMWHVGASERCGVQVDEHVSAAGDPVEQSLGEPLRLVAGCTSGEEPVEISTIR